MQTVRPGLKLHDLSIERLEAERERRAAGRSFEEEAERLAEEAKALSADLYTFLRAAWHVVEPEVTFVDGWHLRTICEHLQAVSEGEIKRLAISFPPNSTKSHATSVIWPAWDWTRTPSRQFITGSYGEGKATEFATLSRGLIRSSWYQDRWSSVFRFRGDENLKSRFSNNIGGGRIVASPGGQGGTGEHGDVIIVDDAVKRTESHLESARRDVNRWIDGTLSMCFRDQRTGSFVIVAQRLHENDAIGHVLAQQPGRWTHLCLPETYEAKHPFVYPAKVTLPSGKEIQGDIREIEGELLCPARIGPEEHADRETTLGPHSAPGQLQQRPAALEGEILKRRWWQWYDKNLLADIEHLPPFTKVIQSWDTTFKDKTTSDFVVGQVWGVKGADRYLLRRWKDRMDLPATVTAMREAYTWIEERWPRTAHYIYIEKSANGVDIIAQLKSELPGVMPVIAKGSKEQRAYAASPILASGNVYLPGAPSTNPSGYDEARTPAWAAELVESCAVFPHGDHDDDVDAFTQAMNKLRGDVGEQAHVAVPTGAIPSGASLDR